jgi:hypothetical protein
MSDTDRILLVKGIAGMGNRLLSLASAIVYAQLARRRVAVDWRDEVYGEHGRNVFFEYFAPADLIEPTALAASDDVTPACWRGRLDAQATDVIRFTRSQWADAELVRRSTLDLGRVDHPERVAVFWAYTSRLPHLRAHLARELPDIAALDDRTVLGRVLRELPLVPPLRERVDAFRSAHLRRPTIGVHVRYGDHRAALRALVKRVGALTRATPDARLFLATDNPEVLRMFARLYPDVVARPHRWAAPGVPLHLDPACPDRVASGAEALVDLHLLAACDMLVIDSSSSFGVVARLLSDAPDAAIHDVARRQSKGSRRRRKLLYRLWKRTGLFVRVPRMLGRIAALTTRR